MVMLDDPGTLLLLETVVYIYKKKRPPHTWASFHRSSARRKPANLASLARSQKSPVTWTSVYRRIGYPIISRLIRLINIVPLKNLSCISHKKGWLPHRILRCLVVKSPQVPPGGWRAVSIFFLSSVLERVMTFVPWCGIMVESDDGGNNYCYHCFYIIVFVIGN